MRLSGFSTCLAIALTSTALAKGRILITEIMYNPASDEKGGEAEWVEIANVGDEAVQIKSWKLKDEDTQKRAQWGPFTCTLPPGGVAVLVNMEAVDEKQFRQAWDEDPQAEPAYQVIGVTWGSLANRPTADNEILRLLDDKDQVVCEVNFQDGGDWPELSRDDGPSIWLTDLAATDFNNGAVWKRSEPGKDGARVCRKTEVFNGEDVGSPGFVPALTAEGVKPAEEPGEKETQRTKNEKDDDTIDY